MTREEAIKHGKEQLEVFGGEHREFIDMAIKALEQEPCEDCVSRQSVSEFLRNHAKDFEDAKFRMAFMTASSLVENADNISPVTPIQRWIPVSERLPEEDEEYLLFGKVDEDEDNYIFIGEYDSCGEQFGIWQEQFDRTTLGCLGSEFYEYASVIAWMPLPEPYKAEMESE